MQEIKDGPFIIADVGSNWRRFEDQAQNKECALEHIRSAAQCGVSAVKFQLFTHEELYGCPGDNTYALPPGWIPDLERECAKHHVQFMCTAFSAAVVAVVDPYVNAHKIASAEMLHSGIRDAVRRTGKSWLVSTGGATDDEVHDACYWPDAHRMVLMECVAAYPAAAGDYNLSRVAELCRFNGLAFGVSDHTIGSEVALVGIGLGATIFEKHFYSYDNLEDDISYWTPDREHSADEGDLTRYCASIRAGFAALGDGNKRPRESEADFVKYTRRKAGPDTFRGKAP